MNTRSKDFKKPPHAQDPTSATNTNAPTEASATTSAASTTAASATAAAEPQPMNTSKDLQLSLPDPHNEASGVGSRLLNLPAELRNKIMHLVVQRRSTLIITRRCEKHGYRIASTSEEPSVLATCKQLREEGLPVHYGVNGFYISCPERILNLIRVLGWERCKMMHKCFLGWGFNLEVQSEREALHKLCKNIKMLGGQAGDRFLTVVTTFVATYDRKLRRNVYTEMSLLETERLAKEYNDWQ